jgi:hypothetical protein
MDRRHRCRVRTPDRQLDLLDQKPSSSPNATPGWNSLPSPTRRTLTDLVTRLLINHAGRAGAARDRRSSADDL